jgi:hypothetical protein
LYRKLKAKPASNGFVFSAAPGKKIPRPFSSRLLPALFCILHQFFLDGSKFRKIKRRKFIAPEIKEIPYDKLL